MTETLSILLVVLAFGAVLARVVLVLYFDQNGDPPA